jgi:hypothetical protein
MFNKTIFLIIFSLLFFECIIAQKYDLKIGESYDNDTKIKSTIYYTSEHEQRNNIFFNTYKVFANPEDQDYILSMEISYDSLYNYIYFSKQSFNQQKIRLTPIKLDASPLCIMKNFNFYDTSLTINKLNSSLTISNLNDSILFTVSDAPKGKIFLHKILIDDVFYKLDVVLIANLNKHLSQAIEYWGNKRKEEAQQRKNDSITQLRVFEEKDLIRKDLKNLEDALKEYEIKLELKEKVANDSLQNVFSEKMDSLIFEVLSDLSNWNKKMKGQYEFYNQYGVNSRKWNMNLSGNYEFLLHVNKEVSINKLTFRGKINNSTFDYVQIPWFWENLKFENEVNKLKIIHETEPLIKDIYAVQKNHIERNNLFNLPPVSFMEILDSVNNVISLLQKDIIFPTIYNYNYQYCIENQKSIWKKRGTKIEDITNRKSKYLVVDTNLLNSFYTIYPNAHLFEDVHDGIYKLRITSIEINDDQKLKKIETFKFKFRYISHIGVNFGSFIGGPSGFLKMAFEDYLYFNVFGIYHHIGLFAGGIHRDSHKHREFGAYIAPWNCRYFYIKGGYSYVNFESMKYHPDNFLVGLSLICPWLSFEVGWNNSIKSLYFMSGLNFPINK